LHIFFQHQGEPNTGIRGQHSQNHLYTTILARIRLLAQSDALVVLASRASTFDFHIDAGTPFQLPLFRLQLHAFGVSLGSVPWLCVLREEK
jgi:hypothetical protein